MQTRRLGKLPARHDDRTLALARYLGPTLPPAPPSVDYGSGVAAWPMFLNDKLGDCTCAAAGHMLESWSRAAGGSVVVVADSDVFKAYEHVSGYNPRTGQNDNGAVELDVLKYWRRTGIGGHKIRGFVSVEPSNAAHIRQAAYLFGGVYIGLALPASAQGQAVWTVPSGGARGRGAPGSWGGHAVNVIGYDAQGLTVITWGAPLRMTWAFWFAYCDEAYAIVSDDFFNPTTKLDPAGFNVKQLSADLAGL